MRGLSVKKIALAGAGAALLGAAFASAATVDANVGDFKFFNNGQPNVKIVVGSGAAISDGIAAAQIAAMLGNLAYSDSAVTGSVQAAASNSTNATTTTPTASGTVTGQSVVLSVTSPAGTLGQQTGSTVVNTQLYDFLDASQSTQNTNRANDAKSVVVGDGVTFGGFQIGPTSFPSISFSGSVSNLGSYAVTENEYFYLAGKSYFDTSTQAYVGDQAQIQYVVNFTQAIPEVTDIINGSTQVALAGSTGYPNLGGRPDNDAYLVKNRNIQVQFMGSQYVITGLYGDSGVAASSVVLGKAAVFKQMKAGDTLNAGAVTLKLVSISPIASGSSTLPYAYFEVSQNGTRLDYFSMAKGSPDYNKNGIILHIRDVFVGGGDTSYADTALYSASLTLTSGQKISFNGDDASTTANNNALWTATVNYVNQSVQGQGVPALSQIILAGQQTNKLSPGQSFSLIATPVFKQLKFLGPSTANYDTLKIIGAGNNRYTVTNNSNLGGYNNNFDYVTSGFSSDSQMTNGFNVTTVSSTYANAFQLNGNNVNQIYIDKYNGRILYKDPNSANLTYTGAEGNVVTYFYPTIPATSAIRLITTGQRAPPIVQSLTYAGSAPGALATGTYQINVVYNDTAGGVSLPYTKSITIAADNASAPTNHSINVLVNGVPTGTNVVVTNATGAVLNVSGTVTSSVVNLTINTINGGSNVNTSTFNTSTAFLDIYEPETLNSASLNGYAHINLFPQDQSNLFNSSSTSTTVYVELFYSGATGVNTTASFVNGTNFQQGFVSPGGMKYSNIGLGEVDVQYPQTLASAQWWFGAPSTTNVTVGGAVVTSTTLTPGAGYNIGNGYWVNVTSIGGTASCSGGATGGASNVVCTPSTAHLVNPLDPSTHLVELDSQANPNDQLIVVGGPWVNSVAANTPGVAAVTETAGASVVRVIGGKVIVAGYSAQDTTDAATALVQWLSQNRDSVRGV